MPRTTVGTEWHIRHSHLISGLRLIAKEVYHGLYTIQEALEAWGGKSPLSLALTGELKRHCAFRSTIVHRRSIAVQTHPIVTLEANGTGAKIDFIRLGALTEDVQHVERLFGTYSGGFAPAEGQEVNFYERLRILSEIAERLAEADRRVLGELLKRYGAPSVQRHVLAQFVLRLASDLAPKLSPAPP